MNWHSARDREGTSDDVVADRLRPHLLAEGTHDRAYEKLGAHVVERRRRGRDASSPSGPRTRRRSRSSATSTAGTRGADPMSPRGESGDLGAVRPRRRHRGALQVRDHLAGRTTTASTRPTPTGSPPRSARRPPRGSGTSRATPGATRSGWPTAAGRTSLDGADRDLRGPPRLLDARARGGEPLADLPRAGPEAGRLRRRDGLHARRVPARRRAPVRRLLGLPVDRLSSPRPAGSARRTTSCPWSTRSTSAGSA